MSRLFFLRFPYHVLCLFLIFYFSFYSYFADMVDSLKAEVKMLLERAEKAEKNILQITNSKDDDVLNSSVQNPNAEHSLTYADAIAALKKNILDLDAERLKLMEIVDLRDSSIALLEESVEKYLSLGEGRYVIFFAC